MLFRLNRPSPLILLYCDKNNEESINEIGGADSISGVFGRDIIILNYEYSDNDEIFSVFPYKSVDMDYIDKIQLDVHGSRKMIICP